MSTYGFVLDVIVTEW